MTAGTPITVAAGTTMTGKDFALAAGGRISGTVTDNVSPANALQGVRVQVYRSNGQFVTSSTTSANGGWISGAGLPAGDYVVKTSNTLGYVDRLYDAINCLNCTVTGGKVVTVTTNATTSASISRWRLEAG